MFRLRDLIGPPPTLRPTRVEERRDGRQVSRCKKRSHSPLDCLEAELPSLEFVLLVISFEYPGVVSRPASVVVGGSLS